MGVMTQPVIKTRTLVTDDGVPIEAMHLPKGGDLAIVLAHGFTLSWQHGAVWKAARRLNPSAGVVAFGFRGHGRSGGLSTLGDQETRDLGVAVAYARELGYQRIAAVGFSMGASVVVRYAALVGGVDAAGSGSGPGRWDSPGTHPLRRGHRGVGRRPGRMITRKWLNTRVSSVRWNPVPMPPAEAAARIAPIPFLVVHGDRDPYFPVEHAYQLYSAAREPKELWVVPGFGHAESGSNDALLDRIAAWVNAMTAAQAGTRPPGAHAATAGAAHHPRALPPAGPGGNAHQPLTQTPRAAPAGGGLGRPAGAARSSLHLPSAKTRGRGPHATRPPVARGRRLAVVAGDT